MSRKAFLIANMIGACMLVASLAIGYSPFFPDPWDAGYEGNPPNSDLIAEGDDHITLMKREIRERLEAEHAFGTGFGGSNDDNGRHLQGSARIYTDAANPLTGPPRADYDGSTSIDTGRIWKNSTAAGSELRWVDGVGGVFDYNRPLVTVLEGDADQPVGGLDPIRITAPTVFCEDDFSTDCIDLHNHGTRHDDQTSAIGLTDFIPNIIQNVAYDASCDVTFINCAGGDAVNCSGDPGGGYTDILTVNSVAIDFTGRRGATSRVLVYASVGVDESGCDYNGRIELNDSVAGVIASIDATPFTSAGNENGANYSLATLQTGVTAAAHTWSLRFNWDSGCRLGINSNAPSANMNVCHLVVVDLGQT